MQTGISESRFYMWRAVFAMAHADHVVTEEERGFVQNYLIHVPFSDEQRVVLLSDMNDPQDVSEMFSMVSDPEDQGQFFQFARELVWCDGDLEAQEKAIKERLESRQIDKVGLAKMENELRKSRADSKMQKTAEGRAFDEEAKATLGFGSFLRGIVEKREVR